MNIPVEQLTSVQAAQSFSTVDSLTGESVAVIQATPGYALMFTEGMMMVVWRRVYQNGGSGEITIANRWVIAPAPISDVSHAEEVIAISSDVVEIQQKIDTFLSSLKTPLPKSAK